VKEEKAPVTQQIAKTPSKKFMLVNALGKIKRDLPIKTSTKKCRAKNRLFLASRGWLYK
jgi:hypothetical protein